MQTYVALLRGINVNGKNLLKMADLTRALDETGLPGARTYIQSGNIVLESAETDSMVLSDRISEIIRTRFGYQVPVLTITQDELRLIRDKNPFIAAGFTELKYLHLTLFSSEPEPESVDAINPGIFAPDELVFSGKAVYLRCPSGYGSTKLTNTFFEKKLEVKATTRNWNTVITLCSMY